MAEAMVTRVDAWHRQRLNFTGGRFEFGDRRLRFVTEQNRSIFDTAQADATIKYPWYDFGGGCRVRIGRGSFRFFFMPPSAASGLFVFAALGQAWRRCREFKTALRYNTP